MNAGAGPADAARTDGALPGDPAPATPSGQHSLQLGRMVAVIVALTAMSTAVLGAPTAVATLWNSPSPVVVLAYVCLLLLPLCIGALAAHALFNGQSDATERWSDRLRNALAVAFLVLFAVLAASTASGVGVPDVQRFTLTSGQTLLVNLLICVTTVCPLVLRVWQRFAYVLAVTALLEVVALRLPDTPIHTQLLAPPSALVPCLMYLGAITWLLHQARNLDSASAERLAQENAASRDHARILARRHVNDFIHDHILSALIPASAGMEGDPRLASTARQALDSLDGVRTRTIPTDGPGLFRAMSEQVHVLVPRADVSSHVSSEIPVPPEVARAGFDALHEAVVNVRRHAGAGADCAVELRWTPSGLRLGVVDDGSGFRTDTVAPGRRGIEHSIIERMVAVGGSAAVTSTPGAGTQVVREWAHDASGPATPAGPSRVPAGSGPEAARRTPLSHGFGQAWNARIATSVDSPGARTIACAVTLLVSLNVWASRSAYTHYPPVLLAFALSVAMATAIVWRWRASELPPWMSIVFPAVIGAANALTLFAIPADGWPMYEAWTLGSGSTLCCAMLMRERPRTAWAGIGALYLTTLAWVITGDQPFVLSVTMLVGHAITVSLWWLAATWSAHVTHSIATELDRHARALARSRLQEETTREMEGRLASVDSRARPLLEQIAREGTPTPELRLRARLLEAELRDEIRAASFTGTPVVTEARSARERGVDVVLLDDTGGVGLPPERRDAVLSTICAALARTTGDTATIRLRPPGRDTLATIVTDAGTTWVNSGTGD